jgi:hypothetical protein
VLIKCCGVRVAGAASNNSRFPRCHNFAPRFNATHNTTAFMSEAPPPLRQRVAKERGTLQRCQLIPVAWSIESWAAAACVCRASPWAASPSPGTGAQGRTLGRQWRVSLLLVFALTPAPRR